MRSVKFHKYATPSGTPVFSEKGGLLRATLRPNAWIGVQEESTGWYRIISAQTDGWIKMEDCAEGCHFDLQPALTVLMDSVAQGYRLSEPLTDPGMCVIKMPHTRPRRSFHRKLERLVAEFQLLFFPQIPNIPGL